MFKILIVDDLPMNIKMLGELLKGQYEIIVANNGAKSLQLAMEKQPDLILMDVMMPEMDGYTACRLLKSQPETADIPVLFITARNDSEDIVNGFAAGGNDYITKPFNVSELYARVHNHIELRKSRQAIQSYAAELEKVNRELKQLLKQQEIVARYDPLTSAANRRYAIERIQDEFARYQRTKRVFSLIMADIDNFKNINDTYGHEGGDFVLKHLVALMQQNLRQQDLVSRWGGEEFLLLLPETNVNEARMAAEKVRAIITSGQFIYNDILIPVTATFGVAEFNPDLELDRNIGRADEAMYRGKKTNKNCVIVA